MNAEACEDLLAWQSRMILPRMLSRNFDIGNYSHLEWNIVTFKDDYTTSLKVQRRIVRRGKRK